MSNKLAGKTVLHWSHVLIGVAMVVASGLAIALTPSRYAVPEGAVDLEQMIPKAFAGWKQIETGVIQMDLTPRDGEETTTDRPYDQSLMRAYVREDGAVVMVALAYGRVQRQEVKVHRPELCYVAQGFELKSQRRGPIQLSAGTEVMAYQLVTHSRNRVEPVTYWIRIGDQVTANAWESRAAIFLDGLRGSIPDGLLVRVSQAFPGDRDPEEGFETQTDFLRDLYAALSASDRAFLTGQIA